MYENLKLIQLKAEAARTGKKITEVELSSFRLALNGVIAGAFSGFIVTPFDVIKTKQMTFDASKGKLSVQDAFTDVWNDAGIQGLYRGGALRAFYIGIGGFAFFGMLEKVRSILNGCFKPAKKVGGKKD